MTDPDPNVPANGPGRHAIRWWWIGLISLPALYLLSAMSMAQDAMLMTVLHIVAGWAFHLARMAFTVSWNPGALALSFGSLAAGVWLLLGIVRWMSAACGKEEPPAKAVLKILAIFLCGCAAAIATSGVMHESAWMRHTPWIIDANRATWRTQSLINARQVLMALDQYESAHQSYPPRLEMLVNAGLLQQSYLYYPTSSDPYSGRPFIYLRPESIPGQVMPSTVLLLAPETKEDKILVGRAFGSVAVQDRNAFVVQHPELHWPEDEP